MTQKQNARQLQAQWEASVAQALEEQPRGDELDQHQLSAAAGLPIRSGVQAAIWGSSHGCSNNCNSGKVGCGGP